MNNKRQIEMLVNGTWFSIDSDNLKIGDKFRMHEYDGSKVFNILHETNFIVNKLMGDNTIMIESPYNNEIINLLTPCKHDSLEIASEIGTLEGKIQTQRDAMNMDTMAYLKETNDCLQSITNLQQNLINIYFKMLKKERKK